MSFDPSFHEKDFSGDETGQIFTALETTSESIGPTERTVDTQSGFIVSVKDIDGRISLSVKRRVGTPPTSSVMLTPDESLKLSKTLAMCSSDELRGLAGHYAAADLRLNTRVRRVGTILHSLPGLRFGYIWSFLLLFTAAALGYYVHSLLGSWLGVTPWLK